VAFPSLDGCVAGQNERCLGQIGFARELLHFAVAQATSIAEDRELIALERAAGKHIKLDKPKCTLGHRKAPSHMYQDAERDGGAENILPPVVLLLTVIASAIQADAETRVAAKGRSGNERLAPVEEEAASSAGAKRRV
jgi:hypothetical protein